MASTECVEYIFVESCVKPLLIHLCYFVHLSVE